MPCLKKQTSPYMTLWTNSRFSFLDTVPYSDHSLSILILLFINVNMGTSDILNCRDVAPASSHYSRYNRSWDRQLLWPISQRSQIWDGFKLQRHTKVPCCLTGGWSNSIKFWGSKWFSADHFFTLWSLSYSSTQITHHSQYQMILRSIYSATVLTQLCLPHTA